MLFLKNPFKRDLDDDTTVLEPLLAATTDQELLVPDPDWEAEFQQRKPTWQRPALFAFAGLLLLIAGWFTVTHDWWVAHQSANLDRQVQRTATIARTETVQKTAQIKDGFEALLADNTQAVAAPLPPIAAPPLPPTRLSPPPPIPVMRRLPPLPTMVQQLKLPAPMPAIQVVPTTPTPKITLVGGNERVVLLDVAGERLQLVPGQTGPQEITVLSAKSLSSHYSVQLRLGNGKLLNLNLAFNSNPAEVARPQKDEPITPLF
ncbi:MAG: hypothetical protein H7Y37_03430 [Anaerolineae bacterium]|nr:hypothetical protein [Gloeobacterales cyanobacterium ES-bin-313]